MLCILTVSGLDMLTDAEVFFFLQHWIWHAIYLWDHRFPGCDNVVDRCMTSTFCLILTPYLSQHTAVLCSYIKHTHSFIPRFRPQVDNNSADSCPVETETIRLMVAIAMPLLRHYDTTLPTLCLLLPVNMFSGEFSRQGANFGLNKLASPMQYRSWDVSSY